MSSQNSMDSVLRKFTDGGSKSTEQSALRDAVLAASSAIDAPCKSVSDGQRIELWEALLLGPNRPDTPENFRQYCHTSDAVDAALSADVELAVSGACIVDDSAAEETRGLLEHYCVKTGQRYEATMAEVLTPLLHALQQAKRPLRDAYNLFFAIQRRWIPNAAAVARNAPAIHELLRLVLQYHDPELSIHLDRQLVAFAPVALNSWIVNLFVTSMRRLDDVVRLWDYLFAFDDAALAALAISLARLRRQRSALLNCHDTDAVTRLLHRIGAEEAAAVNSVGATVDTIAALAAEGRLLLKNTPLSARALLRQLISAPSASKVIDAAAETERLLSFVVLPVTPDDLTAAFAVVPSGHHRPAHISHVVLDCRAEKSFNHARLPTAIHVGNEVGFDPSLLNGVVQRFDHAKGSHMCLLGTGRGLNEENNLLKVLALHFVSAGFPYVGLVDGGFKAVIPLIKAGAIEYTRSSVTPKRDSASAPREKDGHPEGKPPPPSQPAGAEHGTEPKGASAARSAAPPPSDHAKPAVERDAAQPTAPHHDAGGYNRIAELRSKIAEIKPAEVGAKAVAGITTAKSWGLGVMKGWSSAWYGNKPPQSAAATATDDAVALHARTEAAPSSQQGATATTAASADHVRLQQHKRTESTPPAQSSTVTTEPPRFALPDDDDDDGLDLITSVPPRPPPVTDAPVPASSHAAAVHSDPHRALPAPAVAADDTRSALSAPPSEAFKTPTKLAAVDGATPNPTESPPSAAEVASPAPPPPPAAPTVPAANSASKSASHAASAWDDFDTIFN